MDKAAQRLQAARMAVGRAIALIREDAGLNQTTLAQELGVSQRTFSRIELGQQRAFLDQVLAVDEACGRAPGTVLRMAGLIFDEPTTEQMIQGDPALDARAMTSVLTAYRVGAADSASVRGSRIKSPSSSRATPSAKPKRRQR